MKKEGIEKMKKERIGKKWRKQEQKKNEESKLEKKEERNSEIKGRNERRDREGLRGRIKKKRWLTKEIEEGEKTINWRCWTVEPSFFHTNVSLSPILFLFLFNFFLSHYFCLLTSFSIHFAWNVLIL